MKNQLAWLGTPAILDRLARLSSLVLVVLLGYSLAELTWTLWPQPPQTLPPAAPGAAPTAGPRAEPGYRALPGLHLFGQAERSAADAPQAPLDAPETQLNLTLHGILYNPNPSEARAIVAGPGGDERAYGVGDQLPGGATVEQIYPDRVILSRVGRFETLRLPENQLADVVRAPEPSAGQAPPAGGVELDQYRQAILDNPENAAQYLRTEPVTENGRFAGFRLYPGPDTSIFDNSRLEPGDLVTAVNGVELDDMEKGFQALDTIAEAETLQLTVLRDGQPVNVQLQFK